MDRFEEWVRFLFDHPVHEPKWYWAADSEVERWTADPTLTVGWMTQLFHSPAAWQRLHGTRPAKVSGSCWVKDPLESSASCCMSRRWN